MAPNTAPGPVAVGEDAFEVSPFGVLGLAGNVMDFTASRYEASGPTVLADGSWRDHPASVDAPRDVCGSAWGRSGPLSRVCHRGSLGDYHSAMVGFRAVASLPGLS